MYLMCIVIKFNFNVTQFYLPNHNNSCLNVLSFIKQKPNKKGDCIYCCIIVFHFAFMNRFTIAFAIAVIEFSNMDQ